MAEGSRIRPRSRAGPRRYLVMVAASLLLSVVFSIGLHLFAR